MENTAIVRIAEEHTQMIVQVLIVRYMHKNEDPKDHAGTRMVILKFRHAQDKSSSTFGYRST